jgi:glutathione peroxidase
MITNDLFDVAITRIDGTRETLGDYRGNVLLVVNVASECGLTPQYAGLQALYDEFKDRKFSVLGFPCNQFGAQEPGTNEEIARFCTTRFDVTFPMFEKLEVNGSGRHPLYKALLAASGDTSDIQWNFEKFLIDREGNVKRFSPRVTPEDAALREAIAQATAS